MELGDEMQCIGLLLKYKAAELGIKYSPGVNLIPAISPLPSLTSDTYNLSLDYRKPQRKYYASADIPGSGQVTRVISSDFLLISSQETMATITRGQGERVTGL